MDGREARYGVGAGRSFPLGATTTGEGVNFAVFSAHGERVELCLFSDDGSRETARLALTERDGAVWHGHVAGLPDGAHYGYRVHGPMRPRRGIGSIPPSC